MPPWYVLLKDLSYAPTFPLLIGVLRAQELLPRSGDNYADGLLLLRDMQASQLLDDEGESVSVELCGTLKVPVFRIRDRSVALYGRSVFPASGAARGRLSFNSLVEKEKIEELEACYERLYYSPTFGHDEALESGLLSRNRERKVWEHLEDDPDYDEAIGILDEYKDELRPISEDAE